MDFQLRILPPKQQGPGSQRQPRPSLVYGDQRARGEKGKRGFAEQRCICAAVGSPRRVEVSRMQLSEPRFEPWVRWASVQSSLVGSEGLLVPASRRHFCANSCISTRPTTFGVGFQLRRPPAKQQGPGSQGSPDPLWPMETRWLGEKKASVALLSKGALGLWFVSLGESIFPECSSQNLILSRG